MMTNENDQRLLAEAENLHYTQWQTAFDLAEQANSPEVKEKLERIGHRLYHAEEYHAGLL